jgi:hypothetical protein
MNRFTNTIQKKYIRLVVPSKLATIISDMHASRSHLLMNQNVDNPLDGCVLTVKSTIPV